MAGHEQIDRICRLGGGFRMGPFELMTWWGSMWAWRWPSPSPSSPSVSRAGAPAPPARGALCLLQPGRPRRAGRDRLPPRAAARRSAAARAHPATHGPSFAAEAAEDFFTRLGFACEWVEDAPGLMLGRIVAQLINEAFFAVGEGVGSETDADAGLALGLGHPRGPIAWSEAMGVEHVTTLLDALWAERREERYRTAPLLARRRILAGWPPPT